MAICQLWVGGRGLLRAHAGVTARAAGVVEGRRSVPIGGKWRFACVGRDRPTTHARACVASSLRFASDRRLRVSNSAPSSSRSSATMHARAAGPASASLMTMSGVRRRGGGRRGQGSEAPIGGGKKAGQGGEARKKATQKRGRRCAERRGRKERRRAAGTSKESTSKRGTAVSPTRPLSGGRGEGGGVGTRRWGWP